MFLLTLECKHQVGTDIVLRNQYPSDVHYVFCPPCRKLKDHGRIRGLCWTKVVEVNDMPDVYEQPPLILPHDILRLQPGVARSRVRPFPYVRNEFRSNGSAAPGRGRGRKREPV